MSESNSSWEKKVSAVAGLLAAVLVPIALGVVGGHYSTARTEVEAQITSREQAREWVKIALAILQDSEADRPLKEWAIAILNAHSHPDARLNQEAIDSLLRGKVLPSVLF
jgi:hypothetical protein